MLRRKEGKGKVKNRKLENQKHKKPRSQIQIFSLLVTMSPNCDRPSSVGKVLCLVFNENFPKGSCNGKQLVEDQILVLNELAILLGKSDQKHR